MEEKLHTRSMEPELDALRQRFDAAREQLETLAGKAKQVIADIDLKTRQMEAVIKQNAGAREYPKNAMAFVENENGEAVKLYQAFLGLAKQSHEILSQCRLIKDDLDLAGHRLTGLAHDHETPVAEYQECQAMPGANAG